MLRRLVRSLLLVLLAVLVLHPAGATARAGETENESGPNFAKPADLTPDAAAQWERALASYKAAHSSRAGQTEKLAAAIKELKKAKDLAPKFALPGYYLGILYQWTKEFEKARAVLTAAIDLNPRFHQAIVELGDVHMHMKQNEKAIAEYDRAIAIEPKYGHAFSMRGYVKMKGGDYAGAAADFDAAKKLDPTDLMAEFGGAMAKREIAGPGWAKTFTCETTNYRILTPVSQDFADDLGKHAELIFKTYGKIFPKVGKEKRKFTIIVHGSRDEYHGAGGPPTAGGHYDPLLRKLYLFRYEKDSDTKLVLYHEGFHQFLHDYLDDAPQWFNEGLGDFFGPSKYIEPVKKKGGMMKTAEGMELRPNPWRLRHIQMAIRAGKIRAWRKLMLMSQEELYDDEWAGIHYAQSWSIIYFLVRGGAPPGAEAGPYFKILQEYFTALRRGEGQETAFESSFGKRDVSKLEEEWKSFTLSLSAPPAE